QLEVPLETTLAAFQLAKAAGVRTVLNPAPAQALPAELLRLTDICVPNETELELLTGRPVTTLAEIESAARALADRGPATVLVTLGERGAMVVDSEGAATVAPRPVNAIDPTGAGDAFIGSLAVFLAEGCVLRHAVRKANHVAALSVTHVGTQTAYPRRAEVDAL